MTLIDWDTVGEAGHIRGVQPAQAGRGAGQEQMPDADHPQRQRLPLPDRAGPRTLLRSPAAEGAEPVRELPRRRPLGAEAEKQPAMAQGSLRLADEILPSWREVSLRWSAE